MSEYPDWMVGRTPGEISLIRYVIRTRDFLQTHAGGSGVVDTEADYLLQEANYLLKHLGVEIP